MARETQARGGDSLNPDVSAFVQYGPYGFGVVVVLVLWFLIIKPQLDSAKVDIGVVKGIADTLQSTALAVKETALILNATSGRLEHLLTKIREPSHVESQRGKQ